MSLLDSTLWEVIKASFEPAIWKDLIKPIGETLYMTAISSAIVLVFGIILGIFLTITCPDGLVPVKITLQSWPLYRPFSMRIPRHLSSPHITEQLFP